MVIMGMHIWSDYVSTELHEINLKDINGFHIHWRGADWHIVVETTEKIGEYGYRTYEVGHFVYPQAVAKLIGNEECKILSFVNYHSSNNFIENLCHVLGLARRLKEEKTDGN
jgi:hypothetical protein